MAKPPDCVCGQRYDEFRTGLTFRQVRRMMYVSSPDPRDWLNRRRRGVLGFWHQLKRELYLYSHRGCKEHYEQQDAGILLDER